MGVRHPVPALSREQLLIEGVFTIEYKAHFPTKSHINSGSFAENDLQLKASYGSFDTLYQRSRVNNCS